MNQRIALLFLLHLTASFCNIPLFSQSTQIKPLADSGVVISTGGLPYLFVGYDNAVFIKSVTDSAVNIVVTGSQGTVTNVHKWQYKVTPAQTGSIIISAYKVTGTHKKLLVQQSFHVIDPGGTKKETVKKISSQPVVTLEGFQEGNIPAGVAQKAVRFSINPPFKIQTISVTISGHIGFSQAIYYTLNSGEFDAMFMQAWRKVMPGIIISTSNIQVLDAKGNIIRVPGALYRVQDNEPAVQ